MKKMLRWIVVRFILILGVCMGYRMVADGQTSSPMDSALTTMQDQSETDQIASLKFVVGQYLKTDPREALNYSEQLLAKAMDLNDTGIIIETYYIMGEVNKQLSSYDTALVLTRKAIGLSKLIDDKQKLAEGYSLYGSILYKFAEIDTVQRYYEKALMLFQEIHDSAGIAQNILRLGNVFYFKKQFDSAAYYYIRYLEVCSLIGDEAALGKGWVNLGIINYEAGDSKKSKEYLLKSLEINQRLNNLKLVSLAYVRLGFIAEDEQSLDDAKAYYNAGLKIYEQLSNLSGMTNCLNALGNLYFIEKDYRKALNYYSRAHENYQQMGIVDGMVTSYKNMAKIYEEFGQFDRAISMYDSCYSMSREYGLTDRLKELYDNYRFIYARIGNFKKAYDYAILYYQFKDSILDLEKSKTIAELQLQYEDEKKRTQILTLEKDGLEKDIAIAKRTRQRNGYLFGGSGAVLLFIFAFSFIQQRNRKNRIITEQKILQLEEDKKLLAARSIVEGQEEERKRIATELHDGLGVILSSVKMHFSSLQVNSEKEKTIISTAGKLLEQATTDVRRISHNMMPGLLTRFGLFEAVEDLLEQVDELEGMEVDYQFKGVEARLEENTEIMLYRVIQEMINNTLKYAQANRIRLMIQLTNSNFSLEYSDNGKGFNIRETSMTKTLGLKNIDSRVKYLGGKLTIQTALGQGVAYTIYIPHVRKIEAVSEAPNE